MEFFILGPVEACKGSAPANLGGAKQKTLLAALLLAGGRVISDDRLSTLLWGEAPPTTSSAQIYTYVSRLRKQFGNDVAITRRPPGYMIDLGESALDLERFERLSGKYREEIRTGRYQDAARHAREALALWRGPALAGTTQFLADAELPRLEETRMAALEDRIEADLALRRAPRLVPELTRLVAEYPLREQLRVKLMIALYQAGRQADAVSVFHQGRLILKEELGVDPGPALWETHQAVLENRPSLEPHPAPPIDVSPGAPATEIPAMLPPDVADFVGRSKQLAQLCDPEAGAHGGRPPVLLVSGMAGVGKSALAVRAAHARKAEFPDGRLYADLGGNGSDRVDPGRVLSGFLGALGVPAEQVPAGLDERIRLYRGGIAGRRLLVLLDNAVDERQVRPLLPGGDCLTLVTSRRTLAALDGLHLDELEVLDTQESLDMLGTIIGRERLDAEPGQAVRIAERCGGLPLAIRIAGARLIARRHWSLARIADQLSGEDSLDGLVLGDLDVRSRVEFSYRELPERERAAYSELAAAGLSAFRVQAAAKTLGVTVCLAEKIVESLADASLLSMDTVYRGPDPVYRFHDLFMTFAREQIA
ncbi:AfsR/SARP family transcriptional regulator [Actinomadura roseirufa]|uniref:AfsR/SARP family transcriptional regulator n=1 Tax=Actinomadura roseirufa TaxID=2094049 RepID=UPI0013F156CB|nr:AfsR/SARP family transcriptional regulator [Actinomadura roseirufa]